MSNLKKNLTVTIIAAITRDGALGKQGDTLYHISADLRRFKSLTMGHPLIMGRKTLESFPNGPLPGRKNIVVTHNPNYRIEGTVTHTSLASAIEEAGDNAFVIGGGEIYALAMPIADCLEITEIDAVSNDADTFFPEIDPNLWEVVDTSDWFEDPKSKVKYRFVTYNRRLLTTY